MTDTFKNFVGGRWKASRTGQTFENENPAVKGSNLGFFQSSSPDDIDEAIGAADTAFRTWRRTPVAGAPAVRRGVSQTAEGSHAKSSPASSRWKTARRFANRAPKWIRRWSKGHYHLNQVSAFYGHTGPGAFRDITTWVQYSRSASSA